MNDERRQKYLKTMLKNAETKRKIVAIKKTHDTNRFKNGEITVKERDKIMKILIEN